MSGQKEFLGQLYKADPVTKAWSVMCKGLTTLTLLPMGNKRWRMIASKGTEKLMDEELGLAFKHRVKDTFVQWQQKTRSGASETHGFRTKELSTAQELGAVLDSIVYELEKEDSTSTLTILLPDQNKSILKFNKSSTMLQVLKLIAEKHQFDSTQYALATSPEPPGDNPLKLKAAMTVQQLKRFDVMVVSRKKPPKPPQEETIPLEVFLPDDSSFTVHVVPSVSLKELLTMVCSKSSLDPSIHEFDLPIANPPDSLKLQQLKITSIQLIQKDIPKQNRPKESSKSQPQSKGTLKPRKSDAPPPPTIIKPKQLTAGVMQQLKDKMAASGAEEVDHPSPVLQTKQSPAIRRATPPPNRHQTDAQPVAQKSSRKAPPPPPAQKKTVATDGDDTTPKHSRKVTVARRAPPPPKSLQAKHKSVEEVDSGVKINAKIPSPRIPGRVDPTCYKKGPSPSVSPLATRRIMASDIKQSSSPSASQKHRAPPPPPSKKPPSKQPPAQPSQPAKVTISPSKEDGGQVLIVRASPSERRRVVSLPGSLVFKLPPPPPKGPGFHSLKRTKLRDDLEPAVEEVKILEDNKEVSEKEARGKKENSDEKIDSEEEESDVEEEKNDTDLDKSTATSDSDSVMGYHVDSATMLHKEDQSPATTPPPERDELFDVQVDGDALFDEPPSVWHRPAIVPESLSSADSDSHSEEEESSEDEEEDKNDGEDGPGIVLLSVQKAETEITEFEPVMAEPELDTAAAVDPVVPTMLEVPPPPPSIKPQEPIDPVFQVALNQLSSLSVEEAIAREEEAQREKNSAELNELDTMLTSLRSLIADTCEIGGKSDENSKTDVGSSTSTIKTVTPPPPPEATSQQAKPSIEESAAELERSSSPSPPPSPPSPPPSPPPPPPLSPPPLDDELEADEPVTQTHQPKPAPPTTKPKPVKKPSSDESSELLAKLRRRREKSDVPPPSSKTDESPPLPQQPPATESSVPGQTPPSDNVQMQLQFLQQQVLQQQVMQLQQQFQTFQQAMSSGMPQQQQQQQMLNLMQQMQGAMAQQPSAGYPQPATMMFGQQPLMTAPSVQPAPMVQPVMVPPTAGQTPYIMAPPQSTQQLPIMSTGAVPLPSSSTLSQPFTATLGTTPVQPLQQQQQPTAPVTPTAAPPLATVPATGEQQVSTEVPATPVQKERKTSEAEIRYSAMGSAVKKYDDLMQQVQAVDFNELLKPPEDTEEEEETHSSYTGMTAALLGAMQQRRKQLTSETSFETSADTSLRQDSQNDSNGWES